MIGSKVKLASTWKELTVEVSLLLCLKYVTTLSLWHRTTQSLFSSAMRYKRYCYTTS